MEKDLFFCRICIRAKQRRHPSYKTQPLADDICEELHVDLMGPITPAGWNGCRYALTITDSHSRCRWVENLHEKREAGPALRKFVTFIENQTGRKVKRLRMDQGREFGVQELEAWRAEKGIKIEFSVAYSPEMNGIAERTNGLIVSKARCLLFDSNLGQSFWPEAFDTAVYLLNRTPSASLAHNIPLEEFLKAYHNNHQVGYAQDLSHLRTWGCKVSVFIPQEKRVKSQKGMVPSREGFLVGYSGQNIYKIYFPETGKIEHLRDVIFMENDESLETSLAEDRDLFYYPDFNSEDTPATTDENIPQFIEPPVELSDTESGLSPIHSDIETPPRRSTRTRHEPQRYGTIARHLAMSSVVKEVIHEPLTYNEALRAPEAMQWQKAMQEEYDALVENHTWDIVYVPKDQKVLKGKWVYKIKRSNEGTISRYKARWVAKGFEQREGIDYEETFSPVAKSCSIRILFALAAYYGWFIEHLDAVTAYLNSDIDVLLYVELPDGYKQADRAALLRKTIYGLKQSARQWNKNLSAKLLGAGLTRLMSDYSVFIRNAGTTKVVIVIVYVDDFLVFGPNMSEIDNIKWWLATHYKIKDLGPCSQFLGMKVERNEELRTISISQEAFINKALTAAEMENCKGVNSPMISTPNLSQNPKPVADQKLVQSYQSHIGTQMWAYVCTRPDLGFSVLTLSRFSSNPTREHYSALKRVYQYLQDTKNNKLVYYGSHRDHIKLEMYADADWAGDKETRKSMSEYVALLNGTTIF